MEKTHENIPNSEETKGNERVTTTIMFILSNIFNDLDSSKEMSQAHKSYHERIIKSF